jgi:hypothetical protein
VIPARTASAALAVLALAPGCARARQAPAADARPSGAAPSSAPSPSPSQVPSPSQAPPRSASPLPSGAPTGRPCRLSALRGAVTAQVRTGAHPYAVIALTNVSASTCWLGGYPGIDPFGFVEGTSGPGPLAATLAPGAVAGRGDPGPAGVLLRPRRSASFAMSTSTTYRGPVGTIEQIGITLPGRSGELLLTVTLPATGPGDLPYAVTLTGFTST